MSRTAGLSLCRELYTLTGWRDTTSHWFNSAGGWYAEDSFSSAAEREREYEQDRKEGVVNWLPYYDLGYLLRKLPQSTTISKSGKTYAAWVAGVTDLEHCLENPTFNEANTPELAALKLAVQLAKSGQLNAKE